MKKHAFTLAEILIVLVIIGVLTMILLPVAFQSSPDEQVMKFKKGYNTLNTVIRELVSSDRYYQNGDLGTRANGNTIDGEHDGDITYFCETFADTISTKSVDCSLSKGSSEAQASIWLNPDKSDWAKDENLWNYDDICKSRAKAVGAEIVTADGIVFYQSAPATTFGISIKSARHLNNDTRFCLDNIENDKDCEPITDGRWFASPDTDMTNRGLNGFDINYKLFCMDIDGIDKGEDPFGFGIRADGKMLIGYKAKEWLNKPIQKE